MGFRGQLKLRELAVVTLTALVFTSCSGQNDPSIFKTVDDHCFYLTPESDRWYEIEKYLNRQFGRTRSGGHYYRMRFDDSDSESEFLLLISESQIFETANQAEQYISTLKYSECRYEPTFGGFVELAPSEDYTNCFLGYSGRRPRFFLNIGKKSPFSGWCSTAKKKNCSGELYTTQKSSFLRLHISFLRNEMDNFRDIIERVENLASSNIEYLPQCKLS